MGLNDNPTPGEEDLLEVLEPSYRYILGVLRLNPDAKILVHCHAGISRSASIVLYYLMRTMFLSPDETLEILRKSRPIVKPNDWYMWQLRNIYQNVLVKIPSPQ